MVPVPTLTLVVLATLPVKDEVVPVPTVPAVLVPVPKVGPLVLTVVPVPAVAPRPVVKPVPVGTPPVVPVMLLPSVVVPVTTVLVLLVPMLLLPVNGDTAGVVPVPMLADVPVSCVTDTVDPANVQTFNHKTIWYLDFTHLYHRHYFQIECQGPNNNISSFYNRTQEFPKLPTLRFLHISYFDTHFLYLLSV